MHAMSLQAAAGQVLVAGFPAGEPPAELLDAAATGRLGGIVLFKRNIGTPDDVARLIRRFTATAASHPPLLVAVDQEGGRVARLGAPVVRLPPMRALGERDDATLTRRAARVLGEQLATLGFNMDFAPVLDVDTNPDNPVIGDRSFGRSAATVTRHGLAFAAGLHDAGLLSCAKHFPGHGDTDVDSHLALPRLSHPLDRLERVELAPFRAAARALPAIMTAHVIFDALDPGRPATLSKPVIQGLLRQRLGFTGTVISDDLEMKAISERWGIADGAVAAIEAGCDVLLVCSRVEGWRAAREALLRRASADVEFAERLRLAAARSVALRRRAALPPPAEGPARLHEALRTRQAQALERELPGGVC